MAPKRRTVLYLNARIYRAAKRKAARTKRRLSDVVDEALDLSLREDAADEEAIRKGAREPGRPLSDVIKDLRRDGLLK